MTVRLPLLVSAGEASGDRIAALALQALGDRVHAFGMGGAGCRSTGMDVIVPLADLAIMGWLPVVRRARVIARALSRLCSAASCQRPPVALLVGFTTFHQALGKRLRQRGVRVLWCVAPQVWAWRPSRLESLHPCVDKLAVILPFEAPLWRKHGYDVRYVGHPAVEATRWRADEPDERPCLAVLTGSRDQEVRATAAPLLQTARRWCDAHCGWRAKTLVASSLSPRCERFLTHQARRHRIERVPADPVWGAANTLHEYQLALCASGTASLEATLAGVPTVVGYRCDPLTAWFARRFLRIDHIALPNILLGRRAFPELVQGDLEVERLTSALESIAADRLALREACHRVREQMCLHDGRSFGERIAALLDDLAR